MKLEFAKYEGAGNDFVIVDNRRGEIVLTDEQITAICARRFGVGADGLMLLDRVEGADYRMRYFNSDGTEAEMCGNGGRCIAMFAYEEQIAGRQQIFEALDGTHRAVILDDGRVSLMMTRPSDVEEQGNGYLINTGVNHYVEQGKFALDKARELRHRLDSNVNFVEPASNGLNIRTFERGVEGETLACGTGAVAAAIVWSTLHPEFNLTENPIVVQALGGGLQISKDKDDNILLTGAANRVFTGNIVI